MAKRELTSTCCPLISMCMLWSMCTHTHTQHIFKSWVKCSLCPSACPGCGLEGNSAQCLPDSELCIFFIACLVKVEAVLSGGSTH